MSVYLTTYIIFLSVMEVFLKTFESIVYNNTGTYTRNMRKKYV